MTHTENVTLRITAYRKQSLENLAKEKQLTLSDLLRYSVSAAFALFEDKTPAQANEICLQSKSSEILEQLEFEHEVSEGVEKSLSGKATRKVVEAKKTVSR